MDDGRVLTLTFDKGNFYHLLGFHKFEDVVFYSMINDDTVEYTQQDFFEDVYNGKIWYSGYDHDEIEIPEKFSMSTFANSFKEHKLTDKTKHTLERRFPFFTYDVIIKILENKEIVNFESEESDFHVRASKILFHFISDKNRNLNVFIDEVENCFVTSFYLENQKDMYKCRKDGTRMKILHTLCLYIEENKRHQPVRFSVDWDMVRKVIGNGCDSYDKIKKLLKKGMVCTKFLKDNLNGINERITEINLEVDRLENEKDILNLEDEYIAAAEENKEGYVLRLMDYNVDAEQLSLDQKELRKNSNKIKQSIKEKKNLLRKLKDKKEEIMPLMCEIEKLDKGVLKKVYLPLIQNSEFWGEEFWNYFINEFDYLRENIDPRQLKSIYKKWREYVVH